MLDRPAPEVAVALAAREQDHWPHPPPGVTLQGLRQAVAVLCLVGTDSETDTLATLVATHGLDGVPPRRLAALARLIQQLYPRTEPGSEPGGVAAPEPADLAHALIIPVLAANPSLRHRLFRDLDQRRLPRVLALLAAATGETFADQRALVHELLQGRTLTVAQIRPALAAVEPSPSGCAVMTIILAHTRIEESEIEAVAQAFAAFGPPAREAHVEIARRRVELLVRARRDPSEARLEHARLLGAVGRGPEALAEIERLLGAGRPPWRYRRAPALTQKAEQLRDELRAGEQGA